MKSSKIKRSLVWMQLAFALAAGAVQAQAQATWSVVSGGPSPEGGPAMFTIMRTVDSGPASIDFSVAGNTGSPAAANDFMGGAFPSGTVTFMAGELMKPIPGIVPVADMVVEDNEGFAVTIVFTPGPPPPPPGDMIGMGSASSTIPNMDTAILTLNDVTMAEADSDGTAAFTATLDKAVQGGLTVGISLAVGSASAGDVTLVTTSVTFAGTVGETETVNVTLVGDDVVEADETYTLSFGAISGTTATQSAAITKTDTGAGVVSNDDTAILTLNDVTMAEADSDGTAAFTATLDKAVQGGLTVGISLALGTAAAGDVTLVTGSVTFAGTVGETETVNVTLVGDDVVEADETYTLSFGAISGTTATQSAAITKTDTGAGVVSNDDTAILTLNDVTMAEADSDGTAAFTATLDKAVQGGLTVGISLALGTAAAGDVTLVTTSVTFAGTVGETETVNVTLVGDDVVEADETYTLSFGAISGTTATQSAAITKTDTGAGVVSNDDTAILTLNDVTMAEADSDGTAAFTATLDKAVQGGLTVGISLALGTAAAGDVTLVTGSVTFAGTVGETETVNVTLVGDDVVEADETYTLSFGAISGTTATQSAAITKTDTGAGVVSNDDTAILTLNDVTMAEADSDGTAAFTATLDKAVQGGLTVGISLALGTAAAGDVTLVTTSVTFAGTVGETETVNVTLVGDDVVEADETYTLSFGAISGTTATQSAAITKTDTGAGVVSNDDTAILTLNDVTMAEADSDGTAAFTATLDKAVQGGLTVGISLALGTASAGDVTLVTTSVTFAGTVGETETVNVTLVGDDVVEDNETYTLSLGAISGTTATQSAAITKTDTGAGVVSNDDTAILTLNDVTMAEADSDGTAAFTATLDKAVQGGLTVGISLALGTASAGDVTLVTTSVTFAGTVGETETVNVTLVGDDVVEDNETYTLSFGAISGTTATQSAAITKTDTGAGVVSNDDTAAVTIADVVVTETGADFTTTFTATLSAAVEGGFTVAINTAAGTTEGAADYTLDTASVSFAGTVSETESITVTIKGDDIVENNETYTISMGAVTVTSAEQIGDIDVTDTATGTIQNDDSATLAIDDVSQDEKHAGMANFVFTVTLTGDVEGGVTLNYTTADDSATAGSDYTTTAMVGLAFTGTTGETKTINVPVAGDTTDERNAANTTAPNTPNNETFRVNLSTITAQGGNGNIVSFTKPVGVGAILNDDYDTIVAASDTTDPSEHGQNFNVLLNVRVVTVAGASNPNVPAFAGALTVDEAGTAFDVAKATPGNASNVTFTDNLVGTLRNATLTGKFAASTEAAGALRHFNADSTTEMHVVNNIPVFVRRTGALTVNGALQTYNGPNIAVQSGSMPVAFTIGDLIEQINPDRGTDGSPPPANAENGQTVSFTLTPTINAGGPLFAVAPAVAMQTTGYDQIEDLTFTTLPNAAGIATITITATDNGVGGLGTQTTASQTFCISVYGTQPFLGDLAIADRGARVYTGALSLVHTNAGSMAFPTQNMINNTIVDAYELTVVTNAPMAGPLAGKKFLEYVVIDYETILSAKGRGEQGLFGVNSVSQTKRTISTGQNFAVPLGVDLLPFEAGPANRGKFVVADAEIEPNLSKIILVDPTLPPGANQSVLTAGGELFFTTGITVAPEGSPNAGDIYVTDVGNVFGKTVNKNDNPRKIVKINPTTGVQTLLISEINDFAIPITNGMITNLYHPTGIDVDPVSGDLYIADSFSKTVWQLPSTGPGTFAAMLTAFSVDADFIQPVHLAVANGGQFIYLTDGATVPPNSAYAANTRFIHKIDRAVMDATANSTIFTQDGLLEEPRGIEIIPPDPLTGP